jgi:hypothetical protein
MGKFSRYEYRKQPGFDMNTFEGANRAIPMTPELIVEEFHDHHHTDISTLFDRDSLAIMDFEDPLNYDIQPASQKPGCSEANRALWLLLRSQFRQIDRGRAGFPHKSLCTVTARNVCPALLFPRKNRGSPRPSDRRGSPGQNAPSPERQSAHPERRCEMPLRPPG